MDEKDIAFYGTVGVLIGAGIVISALCKLFSIARSLKQLVAIAKTVTPKEGN